MGRFCYCSNILEGKSETVRAHWKSKVGVEKQAINSAEMEFWKDLQMTGFECWMQSKGNLMIHCLEGTSLEGIFRKLREKINSGNDIAVKLHAFYLDVLGKDYKDSRVEPRIECLLDIVIPATSTKMIKKGFVYPLLPHKEQAHRAFRKESMGSMRARHEASMKAFGVFRLTSWLQSTPNNKYIVCYSEREANLRDAEEQLERGRSSAEWLSISQALMEQTGLKYADLSPEVEWLTAK
jgi:hypothetical protein